MWLFLLLLFVVSFVYTVFNLSLSSSKSVLAIGISFIIIFSLSFYPICLELTNQTLETILHHGNVVSSISLFQIFESIVLILFSISHIKNHYGKTPNRLLHWLTAIPSIIFLAGLVFLQTYAFVNIQAYSFTFIAIGYALSVGLLLITSVWLIKKIINQWSTRAEFKLLIGLFQILLAMFLPLIVKGVKVPFSQIPTEEKALFITIATVLGFGLIGLLLQRFKKRRWEYRVQSNETLKLLINKN